LLSLHQHPPLPTLFPYTDALPISVVAYGGTFGTTGHTEWVDGKIHETGFTTTLAPNTNVSYSDGASTYDVDFISKTESSAGAVPDRKSTRLNSSHDQISYAVFCLK